MKISFALLSGGQGRRFGSDKTKALLHGKPLFQYGLELGLSVSEDVMHISRDVTKYNPFMRGVKYIADEYPSQCPMAGMITAANNSLFDYLFILSADTPLFNSSLIEFFKEKIENKDAVVPIIDGRCYCLSGLYSKKMLLKLRPFYEVGNYKILSCLHSFDILYLKESELLSVCDLSNSFININTIEDLKKLQK